MACGRRSKKKLPKKIEGEREREKRKTPHRPKHLSRLLIYARWVDDMLGCTPMQLAFSQYRRKEIDFPSNETETNKYRRVGEVVRGRGTLPTVHDKTHPVFFLVSHSLSFFYIYLHVKRRTDAPSEIFFVRCSLHARTHRSARNTATTTEESPAERLRKNMFAFQPVLSRLSTLVGRKQYVTTVI